MRKFDPWPIFFKREWNRNWPFLVGFAITGTLITKFSLGLTEQHVQGIELVDDIRVRVGIRWLDLVFWCLIIGLKLSNHLDNLNLIML
ncbi:hypothetical protein GBA52_021169 [Prunus armeniaca]|nr:hypothetical protein GBA52_021169 [Prunus armeniaca]